MKRIFIIIAALTVLSSSQINAQDSGFGAGAIFGTNAGLSLKMWTGRTTAIDAGMSWSIVDQANYFIIHTDVLVHRFDLIPVRDGELPVYFGVGAKLGVWRDNMLLGVRIPIGLDYLFRSVPIDIFVEVAPGFNFLPATDFDLDGGLGARYYF